MNTSETAGMTAGAVTSRDDPRAGYPPLGQGPDATGAQAAPRRRLLTVTGVTGIAFTLSWIAGLAVAAPSPKLTASRQRMMQQQSDSRVQPRPDW